METQTKNQNMKLQELVLRTLSINQDDCTFTQQQSQPN